MVNSNVDLEYGKITLSKQMQKVADYYRKNEKKIKYFSIGFIILTFALIVKLGINNVDTVVEAATAITLDEESYTPFKWSENIITSVDSKAIKKFPIKGSHVNWKMQSLNILQAKEHVMEYLKKGDYICIHMRHFNVPYDIIVFQNITMVNPEVENESDNYYHVKEMALDGKVARKKRPEWINVLYHDEGLNLKHATLYNNQAACFLHYTE